MVDIMFGISSHNKPKTRKDKALSEVITCLTKQHSALIEGGWPNPACHEVHSRHVQNPTRKIKQEELRFISSLEYSYSVIRSFWTPRTSIKYLRKQVLQVYK